MFRGLTGTISRGGLFSRGAALLAAGPAADTLPDADAAFLRLLIAAELLAIDFYGEATRPGLFRRPVAGYLSQALADERQHYESLSQLLSAAGGIPLGAADVDFSYPAGSFASSASIAKLGVALERLVLGCYLGAVAGLTTATVRLPVGQMAANEAQHLSVWTGFAAGRPIGRPFASALAIDQATTALAAFES